MAKVTQNWSEDHIGVVNSQWTATLSWDVSGVQNETEAINAVPTGRGASHPRSGYLHCKKLEAAAISFRCYRVTATYMNTPIGGAIIGGGPADNNNTLDPDIRWRWHTSHEGVLTDVDAMGAMITNSAGDPPSNGVYRNETRVTLQIARNEPMYDLRWALGFVDHVNEDDFMIAGVPIRKLTARCITIVPNEDLSPGQQVVRVQYEFEFKAPMTPLERDGKVSPWDYAIPDEGYHGYYINKGAATQTKKRGRLCNGDREPLASPARLDGHGKPMSSEIKVSASLEDAVAHDTTVGQIDAVGNGVLLRYTKYPRAQFSELGF